MGLRCASRHGEREREGREGERERAGWGMEEASREFRGDGERDDGA